MAELDDKIYKRVQKLCAKGDRLAKRKKYVRAQRYYSDALDLIPRPLVQWDATNWIVVAQMDAAFLNGDIDLARDLLDFLATLKENIGNAFFHLRYGQVLFLQGEHDRAADELIRAYGLEGPEMFGEDRKYLEFLATRAKGIRL